MAQLSTSTEYELLATRKCGSELVLGLDNSVDGSVRCFLDIIAFDGRIV